MPRHGAGAALVSLLAAMAPSQSSGLLHRSVLQATNGTRVAIAQASVARDLAHNASQNASLNHIGFDPVQPPAVGKVTTLYYSQTTGTEAQTISASSGFQAAAREPVVFSGHAALPEPSCPLQVTTKISYKTENRKVNQRLASIAVCDYLHGSTMNDLPSCNAASGQVCELMVDLPMPNSDTHQEPYLGAAMALAAYSKVCSLILGMHDYNCQVHRSGSAVLAGLLSSSDGVVLKGFEVPGILNTELNDAYHLHFEHVYLAQDRRGTYEETEFHKNQHDVLHWQHEPPQVYFCSNLACLIGQFINHDR